METKGKSKLGKGGGGLLLGGKQAISFVRSRDDLYTRELVD